MPTQPPRERREAVTLHCQQLKLFGVLHLPLLPSEESFPGVVICHGLAGTKVGKHRLYVRMAETLAAHGIATLRLDFRGCGDSEGSFLNTSLSNAVEDTLLGLDFLKNHPEIDSSRLSLLGRSLGGPIAVKTAKQFKQISSLVLWAPLFTPKPWLAEWEAHQSHHVNDPNAPVWFQGELNSPQMMREIFSLDMQSELTSLIDTPLMIAHSEGDQVIQPDQQALYLQCRQNANAETRDLRLKIGDHHFHDHDEQKQVIDASLTFLTKHFNMRAPHSSKTF
ncbi:MAG: alpha/beta fold hydrolase [Chlamydiia bacterium]|nr:alpha/beta fold hydrolase [Chlamydiia bacterium]